MLIKRILVLISSLTVIVGLVSSLFLLSRQEKLEMRIRAKDNSLKFYGVEFAGSGDFKQLASLGIKNPVAVLRPGESNEAWEEMLSSAQEAKVKPVVWLYESEPNGCWNWTGEDWSFCSSGNRYLDFFEKEFQKGENSRVLAVYGIHEGYHFGRSTAEAQKLYNKIKERAPHAKIYSKIYSDQSNNRDRARRSIAEGGFAAGVCDYCGVLYHPFKTGNNDWTDSPSACGGGFSTCKEKFLADFAADKALIQGQGKSIFVANVQTLDWPGAGYRMAKPNEMKEIGCYVLNQGADGINWYSWGDNSSWQGLNHFADRWPKIKEVISECSSTITSAPDQPSPTPVSRHCQPLGDIDCSCEVNSLDFNYLIANYKSSDEKADLDDSGQVNALDASILLSNLGKTCPRASPTSRPTSAVSPTFAPSPTPGGPTITPGPRGKLKYYGVENVHSAADFDILSQYGIDTVVQPFGAGNTAALQQYYDAAVKNNLKIFIWPLGGGRCGFPWQGSGTSWDISAAHSMLDFIATRSDVFLGINIAHEPYYSCKFSNQEMETIRKEIKDYVKNKYNKEIIVTNKINGVTDSGPFAATGGVADLAEIWLHCTSGGQPDPNVRGAEGTCQQAMERIRSSRETIERNNWPMELLYHFQTFGMAIGGYTMPSAAEMREWGCKMIQSGDLDGFVWYDWDAETGNYNENLHTHRYDAAGEDRWEAMKHVRDNCIK